VDSCVAVQFWRRDSRGCVVVGFAFDEAEEYKEERRVSCRPGAEGAPRSMESLLWVVWLESLEAVVFEVLVGCVAGGAMRRDYG
jgi:hypothetical protein